MNKEELDKWIDGSPYYEHDWCVVLLRKQTDLLEEVKQFNGQLTAENQELQMKSEELEKKVIYKCMVKDCKNHSNEGGFRGDVCLPCYEFITTGKGKNSQLYLNTRPSKQLSDEDIDRNAYQTGMWCDGTPDEWDLDAIRNFARAIIKEMNK